MDLLTYQTMAARYLNPGHDHLRALNDYGIGSLTEAGEALDLIKKSIFDLRPMPTGKLVEEVGDSLWYQGALCTTTETTLHLAYHCTATFGATVGTLSLEDAVRMCFQDLSTASHAAFLGGTFILPCIGRVLHCFEHILQWHASSLEEALEGNIRKLEKRYPDGYYTGPRRASAA